MDQLAQLLAQDDTVIFVGSGVSRWAGLPSWEGLIEALAKFLEQAGIDATLVRREANGGDLLQAASYGLAKLSKPQFANFIRIVSESGTALPVLIHETLMKLGPSCFITTNYDDLLEQAFRRWRNDPSEPLVVLNRQLVEQAEIVQTLARNFVFKPHGDARDVDTIILTREQYRTLQPNGQFNATLPTLMTLLSSRPILFVGFGLRDPDFLHVRDLLANIYRGGMRDHYAIVADPVPDQIDWWRDAFGVHLIGYETRIAGDGGQDHGGLIDLLSAAQRPTSPVVESARAFDLKDGAAVLELARYAASNLTEVAEARFSIRVVRTSPVKSGLYHQIDRYDHRDVEQLLVDGPERLLLIGAPGAGKSFAIRHAAGAFATSLQDACIQGHLTPETKIPIVLDLKLYAGDLAQQIAGRFPPKLTFAQLSAVFPVKLFLDGFNEMPRDHRESGVFDSDIDALLAAYPGLQIVVGSRTTDGLDRFDLAVYELSEIQSEEVDRLLENRGAAIPDAYEAEILAILHRPFYFRLFERAALSLDNVRSPADLYAQYVAYIRARFEAEFPDDIDLVEALKRQGYRSLELGTEAFSLTELIITMREVAPQLSEERAETVLNWLVSVDLLIPLGGRRGAFVHQSVTEYLAACKLAQHLIDGDGKIPSLIALRRWDNVIFLTISMLDATLADQVLGQIVALDTGFAIQAARFFEGESEALLATLLHALLTCPTAILDRHLTFGLERLQFSRSHEQGLRELATVRPSLRAAATEALARTLGDDYKSELIGIFLDSGSAAGDVAPAVAFLLKENDIDPLLDRALKWDSTALDDDEDDNSQRVSALAATLAGFEPSVIRDKVFNRIFGADQSKKRILVKLISDIFWDATSLDAGRMLVSLARLRLLDSLFPLNINARHDEPIRKYIIDELDNDLLDAIVGYIECGDRWAAEMLSILCSHCKSLAERVLVKSSDKPDDIKKLLEFSATGSEASLFDWLTSFVQAAGEPSIPEPFKAIDFSELDWSTHEELLVGILRQKNLKLCRLLLGGSIPVVIKGLDRIDLGDVKPWVDWLVELSKGGDADNDGECFWMASQVAFLIARSSGQNNKQQILFLLHSGEPTARWAIATMVLPNMDGLTIEDFSRDAIAFLTKLVCGGKYSEFRPHIFAQVATEAFVHDHLIPLAVTDDVEQWDNVAAIVFSAGRKLGLRFALPPRPAQKDLSQA